MNEHDRAVTRVEIAATKDESIDFSDIADLDEAFWQRAKLVELYSSKQITLRVNRWLLAYF